MTALALLTLVCVATYAIEIVFGLAGTIIMLSAMSFVYDTKTLVIYSVLPQILVASIGLARSPRTVDIKHLGGMIAVAVLGMFGGLYLFYYFSPAVFQILLAATITMFGVYLVFAPGRVKLGPLALRVLDFIGGVSQALFGISGPVALTRIMATFRQKTQVRNYALAFFLPLNVFRAGSYAVNGTYTPEILEMMWFSGPFLLVTLWFSNRLHFHVNEETFRRVVSWLILLGGLTLFYS